MTEWLEVDPILFKDLDNLIGDLKEGTMRFEKGMDAIISLYAYTALGAAQERSAGPWGTQRYTGRRFIGGTRGPSTPQPIYEDNEAWKIPVRRLTGEYFEGWYVEKIGIAVWMVSNKSREAYFIEYGINHPSTGKKDSAGNRVRVRRPILKLAALQALKYAEATRFDANSIVNIVLNTHSPALFEVASHGAGRTYPLSSSLTQTLQGMNSQSYED